MPSKRELVVTYHAVQRYLERVEHRKAPPVIHRVVYEMIRPKILEIVKGGRLLDARECALFVRMAANLVSGTRRAPNAPAHWGHYYYDESKGVIAVVNHDHAVTTVIVPDDFQFEHLQRFKKPGDPESGVQTRSDILPKAQPPKTEYDGADLEICVSDGVQPDAAAVKAWINNHASDVAAVWMDGPSRTVYQVERVIRSMPEFGASLTDPGTDAIWFIREILDKELHVPRRIVCCAEWTMFILLSLVGRNSEIPNEGVSFSPGTVYAISLAGAHPELVRVRKI